MVFERYNVLTLQKKLAIFSLNTTLPPLLIFTLYSVTWHPLMGLSGYPNIPDYCTRLLQDDSVISSYYLFWTSFTYLPPYFFALWLLLASTTSALNVKFTLSTLAALLFFYSTESFDFSALSCHQALTDPSVSELNVLLLNPLNRFHPFLFYLSVVAVLTFTLRLSYGALTPSTPVNLLLETPRLYLSTMLNLTALFMGSWWALQEGTWGGWWNWDPSEVFGLLPSFVALWYLHASTLGSPKPDVFFKVSVVAPVLAAFYFFIQLNFDLVSHNFGSKFFFFFNHNLFFLEGILACAALALAFISVKISLLPLLGPGKLGYAGSGVWRLLPFMVICYWVFASYLPLVNYFAWNFAGINILNFTPSYVWTEWVLLLALAFHFTAPLKTTLRLPLLCAPLLTMPAAHFKAIKMPPSVLALHGSLLLALLFNLRYGLFYTVTAESGAFGSLLEYTSHILLPFSPSFTLAYSGWEEVNKCPVAHNSTLNTWLLYSESNSSTINQFLLPTGSFWSTNIYILASSYTCFFLKLVVWSPLPLALFFVSVAVYALKVTYFTTAQS